MLPFQLLRTIAHNSLKQTDIAYFKSVIGADNVLTANIDAYNEDWMKRFHGSSKCVLRPPTTEAISQILKHCNAQLLPIVVQSGKTSLVGGSVPVNDEIIISMGRLNKIHDFNNYSSIVTCDAGCILQDVESYVNQKDYILPMDLGAKGSCQVGGNISTHAGGLRYIKYGPLRGNVIGLNTVLANGEILDLSNTMRKDNAGYDLKQLFIGTEGTLVHF
jgi:FAD/FMN-containing dehydrogenase